MLNSISDYTYTASQYANADIQGRIIPSEDVAGLKNAVRLENIAFLSEGISERHGAWFAQSSNILYKSSLEKIGEQIREMYAGMRFLAPDVTYWPVRTSSAREDSAQLFAQALYMTHALGEEACLIPETAPDNLSADYLRHCFYALENLKTSFYHLSGDTSSVFTNGGGVYTSAVFVESDGSAEQEFSDSFYLDDGFYIIGDINGSGHRFKGSWTHGDSTVGYNIGNYNRGYLLYHFSNIDAYGSTADYFVDIDETYFKGGSIGQYLPAKHDDISASKIIVLFKVSHYHGSSLVGAADFYSETKYVAFPLDVTRLTAAWQTNGYAEAWIFRITAVSTYYSIIRAAFPSATFNLARGGTDMYDVFFDGCAFPATKTYKSEIASLGWGWTP